MQRHTLAIELTRQIATAQGKASQSEGRLQALATRDHAFDLGDLGKAGSSTASVRKARPGADAHHRAPAPNMAPSFSEASTPVVVGMWPYN